ncbi:MAG: DUF6785 family protein [Candidatus Latescibacterota bacterium]|nr:DUF6785 family protein [Candidatus Latescibacterota bacterium]
MQKRLPRDLEHYLATRRDRVLEEGDSALTFRAFWLGTFLSFFLAIGAPYGNMIIRGSYMALDFSTPGAIFLFLLLIGLFNAAFKLCQRHPRFALPLALLLTAAWIFAYWPFDHFDLYSPGLLFSTFVVATAWFNLVAVSSDRTFALNRSELVLVYAMLLIVSAICTMGLAEQILPIITAIFYFASPQNLWAERLFPYLPGALVVDDGNGSQLFFEGLGPEDQIPYGSWVEPLMWWALFLVSLYVTMVCVAVILRRQWMERERLPYPIAQVGLAMIRAEESGEVVNRFFRRPSMWVGFSLPMLVGSLLALHRYDPGFPVIPLQWSVILGHQSIMLYISFAVLGFSYFINSNIAAGIWFFHLLSKGQREVLAMAGMTSTQRLNFGVLDFPLLGYQGLGALLVMVLVGLWVGRGHYSQVLGKALGRRPEVSDADEIVSYRGAVLGAVGGVAVMVVWLWLMGTPLPVAVLFLIVALLIFVGITRIVAEAGLAVVRAPMIAPDLMVQGIGSSVLGPAGVLNMSLAFIWAADVRVFVMATCSNALKMIEEMEPRARRVVFWAMVLALFVGTLGSFWMIFHMAYRHGGINLSNWFFQGLPAAAYNMAVRSVEPTGTDWLGIGFLGGGGLVMLVMMWLRQRFMWWPVHPLGFPIGANAMMNHVWFNVFIAWLLKRFVLKYGGPSVYRESQNFFLGLIAGQVFCNGMWLVVDYFTGRVGNPIFWI